MNALSKILLALTAVAALSFAYPASANLIVNGGFETGDFTGWTANNGGSVTGTFDGVTPHSGNFQAVFTTPSPSLIQGFATKPGASYTISFFLALATPPATNAFDFSFLGGPSILNLTNQSAFGYTHYTFTETALTASTTLLFSFSTTQGAWLLDDVSVNPAGVPDGGTTVSLLGCALLGLAALRRFLMG